METEQRNACFSTWNLMTIFDQFQICVHFAAGTLLQSCIILLYSSGTEPLSIFELSMNAIRLIDNFLFLAQWMNWLVLGSVNSICGIQITLTLTLTNFTSKQADQICYLASFRMIVIKERIDRRIHDMMLSMMKPPNQT